MNRAERAERRRFFRIDDEIVLSCREYKLRTSEPKNNSQHPHLESLEKIDLELSALNHSLWQENPALARIVELFNKKISILSDEINMAQNLSPQQYQGLEFEKSAVNISGTGIAFKTNHMFKEEQFLDLFLVLPPSNKTLPMIGKVVSCETINDKAKPYLLVVEFVKNSDEAHEKLIQYIVQRQAALMHRL